MIMTYRLSQSESQPDPVRPEQVSRLADLYRDERQMIDYPHLHRKAEALTAAAERNSTEAEIRAATRQTRAF